MARIRCAAIAANLDDPYLADLIRFCNDPERGVLHFQSLAMLDSPTPPAIEESLYRCGREARDFLHCTRGERFKVPGVQYHDDPKSLCEAACRDADVVICWNSKHVGALASNTGVPIINVLTDHDDEARALAERYAGATPYHVATSPASAKLFPEQVRPDVNTIYRGVDPLRIAPLLGRQKQRQLWQIKDDQRMILLSGSAANERGAAALTAALTNLPAQWIGVVHRGVLAQLNQLHDEACRYLDDRVALIDGPAHEGDVLCAADVLLATESVDEQTVMSAWLSGTPVVNAGSPFIGHVEELIGDCRLAIGDRQSTAAAIEKTQQADMTGMISTAYRIAWNELTIASTAGQWERTVRDVVDRWRDRRQFPELLKIGDCQSPTPQHQEPV